MNRTGPLERASIFVRDTDRALGFYRDILRMDVVETRDLGGPVIASMVGMDDCKIRVTYLTAENSVRARIGLFEIYDPRPPELPRPPTASLNAGQPVLVFDSPFIDDIHRDLKAAGYTFLLEPQNLADGDGGSYNEMIVFDPDGVAVDILRYTPPPGADIADAANRTHGEVPGGNNRTSPVMRVSILVRDTARALAVYRNILGMTVADERTFGGPEIGNAIGLGDCELRATYLTAEESGVGLVGLMEVIRGQRPELPRPQPRIHRGQPALVFSTTENRAIFADLKKAGTTFICEPVDFTSPRGTYIETIFQDPDGIPVSLIQFSPA